MKLSLLRELNAARAEKRRAVLLRWLDSGAERLVTETTSDLPEALQSAVAEALRQDKSRRVDLPEGPVFIQVFNPPLRLVLVGAVHISQALAIMGSLAGYAVTVVDPRRAFASDARFPDIALNDDWPDEALEALGPDRRTAIVALTHDPKLDDPALDIALKSEAFYIAALGSKRNHARRLERLGELGHGPDALARIHGPAGLDIGAVSPAEIAASILGQMTAALRRP